MATIARGPNGFSPTRRADGRSCLRSIDGRFHDLFLRVEGPVVAQLQLVFLASFRWLGGEVDRAELDVLFPVLEGGADPAPARVLHNAPGRYRPITDAIARILENASETLDVVNPYVTDRG